MRALSCCIAALAVLSITASAVAQNYGIEAKVDRRNLTKGAVFQIVVTVQGGDISRVVPPDEGPGFIIDRRGSNTQQSTRIHMVNGQFSQVSHQVWVYNAKATETGTVTIPPFRAYISGQEFFSNEIELEVDEGSGALELNRNLGQRGKWDKEGGQGGANIDQREPTINDIVHIECELDRDEVYQGELVMLRLRLGNLVVSRGSRSVMRGARSMPPPPATEGFYRGPEQANPEAVFTANGFEYRGLEYFIPLYPTTPGDREIPPWKWEGHVQAHVSGRGPVSQLVKKETPPARLKVKPLPDRPDGFSGAVGTFDFRVRFKGTESLEQGVPADLQVLVAGYGNPDAIAAPKLPTLGWATLAAPSISTEHPDNSDWAFVNCLFVYKVTPTVAGEFVFPSMDFTYFDPEQGEYVTRKSPEFKVNVAPSQESNQLVTIGGQTQPKAAAEARIHSGELAPPIRDAGQLRPVASGGGGVWAHGLAVAVPVGVYLCCLAYIYRRRRLEDNPRHARYALARKRSHELLSTLAEQSDPSAVLFKAVAGFVADRLGVSSEGLTSADVKALLRERGVDSALCDRLVRILRKCEQVRFAGDVLKPDEVRALRDAAEHALDELESITERSGRS